MKRDAQRARVYAWEDRVVAPLDPTMVEFGAAQGMVDAIWAESGLRYPPRVERLPAQARCRLADANRLTIRLPATLPSWCLLHELAHAMTTTHDGISDGHGPAFMGVYAGLLARYLRCTPQRLLETLQAERIQIQVDAKASFCDKA